MLLVLKGVKVSHSQKFRKIFHKIDQGPQGLWLGAKEPTDGAEGCNLPQELEKAWEAGNFSSITI